MKIDKVDSDLMERASKISKKVLDEYYRDTKGSIPDIFSLTNLMIDNNARFAQEVRNEETWIEIKNQKEWIDEGKELQTERHDGKVLSLALSKEKALVDELVEVLKKYAQRDDISHEPGIMDALESVRKARQ